MAAIFDKIKTIVVEQLGSDEKDVAPTASFVEDLGADSLDLVELIMALEEQFSTPERKVEIPDEDAEKIGFRQDFHDRPGEFAFAIILGRDGSYFLLGNLAREIANGSLIFREAVIH